MSIERDTLLGPAATLVDVLNVAAFVVSDLAGAMTDERRQSRLLR